MVNSYLKKEVDMPDRIIEREFIYRSIELRMKGNEIILSGKETIKRGNKEMTIELSEKILGKKTKETIKEIMIGEISSRPISLRELKGKKTKEEKEMIRLLTEWHKNANKRNFFIGDKRKNNPR